MKETTVSPAPVGVAEAVLPVRVQEALGELVGAAREGLLALSVGVGLGVLAELMEEEVCEAVGPKGKHDLDRSAVRHGHEGGEVTLGGRRVAVERPRVRSADGRSELPLATYAHFADRDPLTAAVLERMLAGVSTRRYRRTQEPVGEAVEAEARSTSKSAVSRQFVARARENLEALMRRLLDDVRLAVLMVYGISRCQNAAWPAEQYPIPEFADRLWAGAPDIAEDLSMRFEKLHKKLVIKSGVADRMALLAVAQVRALATPLAVEELLQGAAQNGREMIRQDPVAAELMLLDEPIYPSAVRLFWRKIIDDGFDWTAATPQQRIQARDECAWSLIPDLAPMELGRLGPEERIPPYWVRHLHANHADLARRAHASSVPA